MSSPSVFNIAFDCADPYGLARFWSAVTGDPVDGEDGPGARETAITLSNGINLYFQQVPEPKTVKNRVHVCLRPDAPRDDELERVLGLGATVVEDCRGDSDDGWVVLADPEGNEFCMLHHNVGRA
ncbi:VOC family protein [Nesterenkonia ebinurensis]|uniref:VOC family protein n=1 Tax=Nesterenkonia ebinurensis TaxID=2608252 RepID=UPI00123D05E6|nr:VOC family protein [Nesterenkonia ebinurensis]